jgi:NAD(P)H-hydrate epimerase
VTDYPRAELPDLTTEQMREVDRLMVDQYGMSMVQMMENAGRNLADLATTRYVPRTCTVLVGSGGNGGGGLVAARHLHNRGVDVNVVLAAPIGGGVPHHQLAIVRQLGVPIVAEPLPASLVIDAMIGYGLDGDPTGETADAIRWANASEAPILALDVPSGLDATSGRVGRPCIVADATLTLALPKVGLRRAPYVAGELFAADISVPESLYESIDVPAGPWFGTGPIVRLPDAPNITHPAAG